MNLVPHPTTPPLAVAAVDARCSRDGDRWHFRYRVEGIARVILPGFAAPERTDGLWHATCFEAFVGGEGNAYREYNLSPSGQWAAYRFTARREGMRDSDEQVEIRFDSGEDWLAVEAVIVAALAPGSPINLTAVIEEEGGYKSYWALAHPDGPPDFHDPSCFVARLPE